MIDAIEVPDFSSERDISESADWVEMAAARSDRYFTQGSLQGTLSREGPRSDDPAALANEIWAELSRRAGLAGTAWPLRMTGSRLIPLRMHPNSLFHYFLCSLSLGADVTDRGRRLFEHCVAHLVTGISGNYGLRLGSPRSSGLPTSLDAAVSLYSTLSNETKGAPFFTTDKDFGLDVVSWHPFTDDRGGYLQFIGQCATGKDWYEDGKLTQLQVRDWDDYLPWAVEPVRFFAVPFVVPPVQWRRASRKGGLILDRPRLLELSASLGLSRRILGQMLGYCRGLYQDVA